MNRSTHLWSRRLAAVSAAALLLGACGSDAKSSPETTVSVDATVAATGDATETSAAAAASAGNACPVDGCSIKIVGATKEGDEIALQLESNFDPNVSLNHYHIYWDKFSAEQVSNDAEAKGVTQGEWIPTADSPSFTTKDVISVQNRGSSSKLCVTPGDRDHNVIDASLVDCRDVSSLL
jgi:hypothetical protein